MQITTSPKREVGLKHLSETQIEELAKGTLDLMNVLGTDIGRASHYNTKEEADAAAEAIHNSVFLIDRTIYGCLLCMGGVTDTSVQRGMQKLLENPWNGNPTALPQDVETKVLNRITKDLQITKLLNTFIGIREKRINNARTRGLILSKIVNADNLEWWSIKYRSKLRDILEHALNQRMTGIIKSITSKLSTDEAISEKEDSILFKNLLRYNTNQDKNIHILRCVSFILGNTGEVTLRLHKAFNDAKTDLKAAKILPPEVVEGIRAQYHKDVPKAEVIKLTKDTSMTEKQKRLVQKTAAKDGVKVEWDPMKQNMVELYVYALEMGLTEDIVKAINIKGKALAKTLPFAYDKVAIILDDSQSMRGDVTAKLRPYAVAHATKDMLFFSGKKAHVFTTTGRDLATKDGIVKPRGDTSIAEALVRAIKIEPDVVFVISDGYENSPAGRFAETMKLVRGIGVHTPVYHINPVMSSDSKTGLRRLSPDVPVMPINRPEAIGLTIFKSMLEAEPAKGIVALVNSTLPLIEGGV